MDTESVLSWDTARGTSYKLQGPAWETCRRKMLCGRDKSLSQEALCLCGVVISTHESINTQHIGDGKLVQQHSLNCTDQCAPGHLYSLRSVKVKMQWIFT